ncbi:MAG: peptide chain release factor N(5)-glutamine methyltransferase [Ignavibacteria bacterium]|nr:peptide chain release factor N(5)-glutamine methyltransferase [Ignavibacteria bacterium]
MLKKGTKSWTVRSLMKFAIEFLQEKGIEEARRNAELLMAHTLKCPRIDLYTDPTKPISAKEFGHYKQLLERRINREPLQYIIGTANFMGLLLRVDGRVLIPRPETESLVEQTMLLCGTMDERKTVSILDIGTGSGNIAIALAKYVKRCEATAIDISEDALEIARFNALLHEVADRIDFRKLSVFEPVDQLLLRRFTILVSNPPYVSMKEWEDLQMEIRRYEPKEAVSDGKDGYEFHRRIVDIAPYLLQDEGWLAMEMGFGQVEEIVRLLRSHEYRNVNVTEDLGSIPRVVTAQCSPRFRNEHNKN